MALLVRVISIWITPARRENVPDISRPLAFMAGSQTLIEGGRTMLFLEFLAFIGFNNVSSQLKTHCFWRAVHSHRHANATSKVKEVIQATAHRGTERRGRRSWWSTKTSPHLGANKQSIDEPSGIGGINE